MRLGTQTLDVLLDLNCKETHKAWKGASALCFKTGRLVSFWVDNGKIRFSSKRHNKKSKKAG